MRIYLVRHGQTVRGREETFRGRMDAPLDDMGRKQAAAVATALRDVKLVAVYTSPLSRSVDTARAIAVSHGINIIVRDALTDIDVGEWEGLSTDRIRSDYGRLYLDWQTGPDSFTFPGGESLSDVSDRAMAAMGKIVSSHEHDDELVIVSHRVLTKLILLNMLHAPVSSFWKLSQDPCCINVVDYTEAGYVVESVNCISHLA